MYWWFRQEKWVSSKFLRKSLTISSSPLWKMFPRQKVNDVRIRNHTFAKDKGEIRLWALQRIRKPVMSTDFETVNFRWLFHRFTVSDDFQIFSESFLEQWNAYDGWWTWHIFPVKKHYQITLPTRRQVRVKWRKVTDLWHVRVRKKKGWLEKQNKNKSSCFEEKRQFEWEGKVRRAGDSKGKWEGGRRKQGRYCFEKKS